MKTIHIENDSNLQELTTGVKFALTEVNSNKTYLRVITCGKAVIILPDTDRSRDCEMPELLKAMGVTTTNGKQPKLGEPPKTTSRENYIVSQDYDDRQEIFSLTKEQVRLLEALNKKGLLIDSVHFEPISNLEVYEI